LVPVVKLAHVAVTSELVFVAVTAEPPNTAADGALEIVAIFALEVTAACAALVAVADTTLVPRAIPALVNF
jgi:hypothetical protein